MAIGINIKELRTKAGLTQKELADQLHITYQAISRWENDDAEPSIDMLKDMCKILDCSLDELLGVKEEKEVTIAQTPVEPVQVIEKIIVQETKPVLAVCEKCNQPIFESDGIHRINVRHSVRHGRFHRVETKERILCTKCNDQRIKDEEEIKQRAEIERKEVIRKRRIKSFVWPSIIALFFVILALAQFSDGNGENGGILLLMGTLFYFFSAVLILKNNFVQAMWEKIVSWSFVTFPNLITTFDIDGFIWLITMKILFFFIGIALFIIFALLATTIALYVSPFVYPFALRKNIKNIG